MKEHINLLYTDIADKESVPKTMIIIILITGSILLILTGYVIELKKSLSLKKDIASLSQKREVMKQEAAGLTKEIETVLKTEKDFRTDEKERQELLKKLLKEQVKWSEIMREISLIIPQRIWFTDLETTDIKKVDDINAVKKKIMRLRGYAFSQSDINDLISSLEDSRYLQEIDLVYSGRETNSEKSGLNFEITAKLR